MLLSQIAHFLIQTTDMAKTRDWYVRVLGMEVGPNPDFKFPVCWLYLGGRDIVHITEGAAAVSENRRKYIGQESQATHGTGVLDHIAFRASGLLRMLEHLRAEGVDFKQRQLSEQGLYQLFMLDPNGIKIELNYANDEARGLRPELLPSELP